jgi:hypothetical protein
VHGFVCSISLLASHKWKVFSSFLVFSSVIRRFDAEIVAVGVEAIFRGTVSFETCICFILILVENFFFNDF